MRQMALFIQQPALRVVIFALFAVFCTIFISGCWAPLRSPGIPASQLPDDFRIPTRTAGPPLNFSQLTIEQPPDYLLGANDVLTVTIPELKDVADPLTVSATVMSDGNILLPMAGSIEVGGMNLINAQQKINEAYADGILKEPQVSIALETKANFGVLVLSLIHI